MEEKHCCLVTGGSGFLGAHVVADLVKAGYFVIVLDVSPFNSGNYLSIDVPLAVLKKKVVYLRGDIRNLKDLENASKFPIEAVFHVASLIDLSPYPDERIQLINVEGTKNVIKFCRKEGIKFLIYTSSMDVVFSGDPVRNGDESLPYPTSFKSDYIRTKIIAEKLILKANSENLKTVSLRPSHIYGCGDFQISKTIEVLKKKLMPFRYSPESIQDYVYVENMARAHTLALEKLKSENNDKVAGEAFFITDHHQNMFDHLKPFLDAQNANIPSFNVPRSFMICISLLLEFFCWIFSWVGLHFFPLLTYYVVLGTSTDFYFSSAKAERLLGFKRPISRQEAEEKTLLWVKTLT